MKSKKVINVDQNLIEFIEDLFKNKIINKRTYNFLVLFAESHEKVKHLLETESYELLKFRKCGLKTRLAVCNIFLNSSIKFKEWPLLENYKNVKKWAEIKKLDIKEYNKQRQLSSLKRLFKELKEKGVKYCSNRTNFLAHLEDAEKMIS